MNTGITYRKLQVVGECTILFDDRNLPCHSDGNVTIPSEMGERKKKREGGERREGKRNREKGRREREREISEQISTIV